jgi:hypothetical protein
LGNQTLNTTTNSNSTQNTCIGNAAGNKIGSSGTTVLEGSYNAFVGSGSGNANTTGYSNVGLGLNSCNVVTSGNSNVCVGSGSGGVVSTNTGNVTGNFNTYIGHNATALTNALSNSTAIGTGAVVTASNQVVLGTSSETVVVPSGLIQTGATTLNVSQTPQLNTANTFTAIQTYNGINVHNANLSMIAAYNLVNRNFMGSYTSIAPASFNGTASISGTTMTTTVANSQIAIGTLVFGAGVTDGTVVTSVASSTSFTVNNSQSTTPTSFLSIGAVNIVQIATINNGTPGVSGNVMTITGQFLGLTLPIGTAIFGSGVTANTRVTGINTPTEYTLSVIQ